MVWSQELDTSWEFYRPGEKSPEKDRWSGTMVLTMVVEVVLVVTTNNRTSQGSFHLDEKPLWCEWFWCCLSLVVKLARFY